MLVRTDGPTSSSRRTTGDGAARTLRIVLSGSTIRPPHGGSVRRFVADHPRLIAAGLAAAVLALSVVVEITDVALDARFGRSPDVLHWVLVTITVGALLVRRSHPTTAITVAGAAVIIGALLDYPEPPANLVLVLLLYSTAVYARRDRASGALVVTAGVVLVLVVVSTDESNDIALAVGNSLVFGTAWFFGDSVRFRRAYEVELEERTRLLEADQDARARSAVAEERRRITRELHDVVAHGVSVMVIQAGAARRTLRDDRPDVSEALETIETTGRSALRELRRVLTVLRGDDGDQDHLGPQPGLADHGALVERCREVGTEVRFHADDLPELSPGRELTAFRVVQEALTNAIRHAGPGATIDVRLHTDAARALSIEVTDDGRGSAADPSSDGAGFGLVGLRERLAVFDGERDFGPRVGGGWALRATLPAPDRVRS